MSRKMLRPRPEATEKFFLPSSPCVGVRIRDFPISADSSRWRDDVIRLLTRTSSVVVRCQPWFYLRLEAYSFFWLSEGAYSLSRDSRCSKHTLRLTRLWRLTLEPKRQKNRKAITRNESSKGRSLTQRLSCLLFQMFCVETNSFCAAPNNWKHRGNVVERRRQARKPKCRIRTKPCGSRCSRKRRKNLSCDKAVSFCSLW